MLISSFSAIKLDMTISEARQIVAEYQALLDLGEWEIKCRWAKRGELPPDEDASIDWQTEHHSAKLILDRQQSENVPHSILHELGHLRLEGHGECVDRGDKLYELGLNRIASAILAR